MARPLISRFFPLRSSIARERLCLVLHSPSPRNSPNLLASGLPVLRQLWLTDDCMDDTSATLAPFSVKFLSPSFTGRKLIAAYSRGTQLATLSNHSLQ